MRRFVSATAVTLLMLCLLPAFAEQNIVGQPAPEFVVGSMINPVDEHTLDDCRGEVILIKYWGIN